MVKPVIASTTRTSVTTTTTSNDQTQEQQEKDGVQFSPSKGTMFGAHQSSSSNVEISERHFTGASIRKSKGECLLPMKVP